MSRLAVHLLFLLSGISGLIYQVIWVREFGSVFGNTVYSASIVTAVFMGGLGVGSLLIGRYSDRTHLDQPSAALRAYGLVEIAIGLLGLAVALILPQLEGLSSTMSSYTVGSDGWFEPTLGSYLVRYSSALLLLSPITLLMGGTLTLLIRFVVSGELARAGTRIGWLYGLNTAGAALGAFATDFALIPSLGIFRAELVAIGLNWLAGIGALLLARRNPAEHTPPTQSETSTEPRLLLDVRVLGTSATLFVTGFVAMGVEIVWFRYLISQLGGFRAIFSLLMTVILTGIFLGSLLGGSLDRRTGRPVALFLAAQTAFILLVLGPMAWIGPDALFSVDPRSLEGATPALRAWSESIANVLSIAAVVGPGALLMGCTFPLGNAHVQRVDASVGGRAGFLYLANTTGNVAGSLVTAFVLLPGLGQQLSIGLLAILGALGLLPLYWTVRAKSALDDARAGEARRQDEWVPAAPFAAALALVLVAITAWIGMPSHRLLRYAAPGSSDGRVIAISEGINETTIVLEKLDGRWLYTNGHAMTANNPLSRRYMRLFSHVPLLAMDEPKSVLVICFGVGNTLHAASLHESVMRLDAADLSRNVLRQAPHFEEGNRGILEDERVSVYLNDGRQHLRTQPRGTYDLITLEPPPLTYAGVASLYSREFYELARTRLTPEGFMTQWLPAYQISSDVSLSIIRAFLDVFPNAALLSGANRELILIGSAGTAVKLDPARIRARWAENPLVRSDLQDIGAGSITALIASFVAGPDVLETVTADVRPVTDDLPLMEFSSSRPAIPERLDPALFDAREIDAWCPNCFDSAEASRELADLPRLLRALQSYYESDHFLEYAVGRAAAPLPRLPGRPCELDAVRESAYFTEVFQCRR